MKQVFDVGGEIRVEEVPIPLCGDNQVLVQNMFSVMSIGTESSSLRQSGRGIIGLASRVRSDPDLVGKAIDVAKREGVSSALSAVRAQAQAKLAPLGYSSSGVVIEAGRNVTDISTGHRVACAGAGYASHADLIAVPRNLVCVVPEGVDFDEAAFTTLGAIAMQGIRRAQVQLGDNVIVIGLGLLGQIACQILKAAGASVIGIDPVKERAELAGELGANICLVSGKDIVSKALEHTGGIGADSVIIYAATSRSEPVRQAMHMARKKGRVVVVGVVGMELEWSPFYEKELDLLISCSYGPGRYDPRYEEKGIDYPVEYVRWTENRNMQEFLSLLRERKIDVARLVTHTFPIEEAKEAYTTLDTAESKPIAVLFKYPPVPKTEVYRKIELKPRPKTGGKINVAVIGAGSFAQAYHLPNLKRIPLYNIRAIVTKTGTTAKRMAARYGAQYCSTEYKEVFSDKDVDMVLIATRHDLHTPLVIGAARAGKHIFVEKPIALTYEQCQEVYEAITDAKVNLTVGFNRRFSPLAQRAKKIVESRKNPAVITYRVNSAGMKTEHWINDPLEGGGAVVGEGCHFLDFISWLIGAEPRRIHAEMISSNNPSLVDANNVVCTLSYEDGSVASLIYNTIGNEFFPKERIEVFMDGGVAAIDDFRELLIVGLDGKGKRLSRTNKGQLHLLQEYGRFLKGESSGADLPTVQDGIRATICSLKVLDALRTGRTQEFDYPW